MGDPNAIFFPGRGVGVVEVYFYKNMNILKNIQGQSFSIKEELNKDAKYMCTCLNNSSTPPWHYRIIKKTALLRSTVSDERPYCFRSVSYY